jgi:hypothetical protein
VEVNWGCLRYVGNDENRISALNKTFIALHQLLVMINIIYDNGSGYIRNLSGNRKCGILKWDNHKSLPGARKTVHSSGGILK